MNPAVQTALFGQSYCPEARAYFGAMTVQESPGWKKAHDVFIRGLKADGLWTGIDWLLFFWANTKQGAILNARYPTESGTETGGTLTHSPGHYMAGDGAASYLALAAQGAHGGATQNSCSAGFHVIAENAGAAGPVYVLGATTNSTARMQVGRTSGAPAGRMGDGTNATMWQVHNPKNGFWFASRVNSTEKNGYFNDTLQSGSPVAQASSALGSNAMWLWKDATAFSSEGLGLFVSGAGWDATQLAAFNARKATLITAIGA